ncbi:MAG: hypothetical protein K2W95_03480 [Candidatus Obscuribacterales bacterium]|nr:hypothetical protein [Candidatus Obscuribacterales bacterium]
MAKAKGQGSVLQGILVMLVLLLCSGGLGFAVGYTQQFAPVEKVPPGTPGAVSGGAVSVPSSTDVSGTSTASAPQLKKAYWIATSGFERAGYAIKVYINDQEVGSYQTPARIDDITKYVHVGDNKVRFVAKALPAGNRQEYSGAHLTIAINQGEKYSSTGYKNPEKLVEYERKITETQDFDDTMDFSIVE